ncbi:MAG: cation diffusion facilitator family transporter [Xanthobacteraceae bacterium]|nr:cation diffusion facilitator family transporter [Xanthobacteraceae bacterium]
MHTGHGHGKSSSGSMALRHRKPLAIAFGLTLAFMVVEIAGGLWTGSLALLADAGHMLTDAGGLALALLAVRFAARPATPQKTYGYLRAEILAALANAVALLIVAVYILYEAYQRFVSPPEILGGPMLLIAVIGLAVNFVSMRLLSQGASESVNVKGAYFEVLSDMLGSLGVIAAALVVIVTGWKVVDPIVGAGIGLFIVPRTWALLKQVANILLEGTPPEVDVELLEQKLLAIDGVRAAHDLHVWTITSGLDSMSGHLVVANMSDARRVLSEARAILSREFEIEHVTIQIEDEAFRQSEKTLNV